MESISWTTVAFQIFNFLLLAGLLYRFLYGPITSAMEEREHRIQQRMEEARKREHEAEREAMQHRQAREELEERRDELIEQARKEAARFRQQLLDEAREEVEAAEERWHQSLREERDAFMRELRRRLASQVCSVARQALADLANTSLQAQVIEVFIDRTHSLSEPERARLREALSESRQRPRIITAFELSEDQRERLIAAGSSLLDTSEEFEFSVNAQLLCGVELSVDGRKLSWSIDAYLDSVQQAVDEALEREITAGEAKPEEQAAEAMPSTEVEPPGEEQRERAES